MHATAPIDFVILSYNRKDRLQLNIERILQLPDQQLINNIIVVDNASTDGTVEMLKVYPRVTCLAQATNTGVTIGRNIGAQAAEAEFVIFLDDDVLCPMNICSRTMELFTNNKKAGCISYRIYDVLPDSYSLNEDVRVVCAFFGAGFACRREVMASIGYMDVDYFYGAEEIDLSLRFWNAGYEVLFAYDAVVEHHAPVKKLTKEQLKTKIYHWNYCWLLFYWKHFPTKDLYRYVLFVQLSQLWYSMKTTGSVIAPFRAFFKFLKMRNKIVNKRKAKRAEVIAFYNSPDTRPVHYNKPIIKGILKKLGLSTS